MQLREKSPTLSASLSCTECDPFTSILPLSRQKLWISQVDYDTFKMVYLGNLPGFSVKIRRKVGIRKHLSSSMSMPRNSTANEDTDDEISNFLMNMEKYRQDELNAFDIMEANATMGSKCLKYRKLRVDASVDRQDKAKRFKFAVSDLQTPK